MTKTSYKKLLKHFLGNGEFCLLKVCKFVKMCVIFEGPTFPPLKQSSQSKKTFPFNLNIQELEILKVEQVIVQWRWKEKVNFFLIESKTFGTT